MKKSILLLMFFAVSSIVYSQPNQGGTPLTYSQDYFNLFLQGDTSQNSIASYVAPATNNETARQNAGVKPTLTVIGINVSVDIDVRSAASMQYLADSSKLYLMKIVSSTASGIAFHFNKFNLPTGTRLFFYNASKTMYIGSFTNKNNSTDSIFNTQGIIGDTIFIEYYEPKIITTVPKLHIYSIRHEFSTTTNTANRTYTGVNSLPCEIDMKCNPLNGWESEASSAALIIMDDGTNPAICGSGALLNDALGDGYPYFLTANHLINEGLGVTIGDLVSDANAKSFVWWWEFRFSNYQSCPPAGGGAPVQNPYNSLLMAKIVARNKTLPGTDYLLLDLTPAFAYSTLSPSAIFANWGVCYSGWDNSAIYDNGSNIPLVCFHFPQGDFEKVSYTNNSAASVPSANPSGVVVSNPRNDTYEVIWDNTGGGGVITGGVTEKGSSGSPLYYDHRVIGQLYGDLPSNVTPDCNYSTYANHPSTYGEFYYSWRDDADFSAALTCSPYSIGPSLVNTLCPGIGGIIGFDWTAPDPMNGTPASITQTPQVVSNTSNIWVLPSDYIDMNGVLSGNKVGQHPTVSLCPGDKPVIYLNDGIVQNDHNTWKNYFEEETVTSPCGSPHLIDDNCATWDENIVCNCHVDQQKFYLSVYPDCDENFNNCGPERGTWHHHTILTNVSIAELGSIDVSSAAAVTFQPGHYYKIKLATNNDYYGAGPTLGWNEGVVNLNMAAYDVDLSNETAQTGFYAAASHIKLDNTIINGTDPQDVINEAGVEIHMEDGTAITGGYHGYINPQLPCYDGHRYQQNNDTPVNKENVTYYPYNTNNQQPKQNTDDGFVPPGISKKTKTSSGFIYKYSIWPNPSNSKVNIAFNTNDNDKVTINIYTSLGVKIGSLAENQIYNKGENNIEYNVSTLQEGMYLVEIKNNEQTNLLKLNVIR